MLAFRFWFSFLPVLSVLAIPTRRSSPSMPNVILEQINSPPDGWTLNGTAAPNHQFRMFIGLKSKDIAGLEKALYNTSTPGSAKYGQHLTKQEVSEFAAPSKETTIAVQNWLTSNGIQATNVSSSGEWLGFNITVAEANRVFKTQYNIYTQKSSGKQTVRSLTVSVPGSLFDDIDVVHPTTDFPHGIRANYVPYDARQVAPRSASSLVPRQSLLKRDSSPDLSACKVGSIVPECILALYGMPPTVGPQNVSRIAVAGFQSQFAQETDLKIFLSKFRPDLSPNTTFTLGLLDGGQDPQDESQASGEANLDTQYTAGMAGGVPTIFITVGDDVPQGNVGGFTGLLIGLIGLEQPPQVLTVSYGQNEPDVSPSVAQKFCNSAMQLTALGVSILFAAGDGGVGGDSQGKNCKTFVPAFPAGCPFITSVGATQNFAPETGTLFSSGGFSNLFSTPPYQKAAVNAYLQKIGNTNAGLFNSSGRGFPDISVQGNHIATVSNETTKFIVGTSSSAPILASFVAEVNALRLQEGKSVLGFLNPLLYSNSSLFTDITSGNNPGCNTSGFPATTGWDPITGVGTPLFANFRALP